MKKKIPPLNRDTECNCSADSQHESFLKINNSDEINILEYVYVLIKNKWLICGIVLFGLGLGYSLALIKGPTFVADAIIATKKMDSQNTHNITQFGAFSGLVASQLSISGNPDLDKIDLYLDSKKFSANMIEKYNLLPTIYRHAWPKEYGKWYDNKQKMWSPEFRKPDMLKVGAFVKKSYLKKGIKRDVMQITVESGDSSLTDTLIVKYLEYLNVFIKKIIQADAKENIDYLEKQITEIADPLLREKLQNLIANEVEKSMLVSNDAYILIDPPCRIKKFKELKTFPLVFGIGFLLTSILLTIFGHTFFSKNLSNDENEWIHRIKKELFRFK